MHVPHVVIRSAAGLLAAAAVLTAWQRANPRPVYRAAARVHIAVDPVTSLESELKSLGRLAEGTGVAVVRADGPDAVELFLQTSDPAAAASAVNGVIDAYLSARSAERARRAEALLTEVRAGMTREAAVVKRAELERNAAQTLVARTRRDQDSARAQLKNIEEPLARARARVAELEPVVTHLRSGRSAEALSLVQGMPFVRAGQERLAALDAERAGLLTRYGPSHPEIARNRDARQTAVAALQAQIADLTETLTQDYDAARLELASLEPVREKALQVTDGPLPSRAEYVSMTRRVDEARASLTALEQREQQLAAIVREPGSGVARVDRAEPVRPLPRSVARWPWALALLAALAAAMAAPSVLKSFARTAPGGEV